MKETERKIYTDIQIENEIMGQEIQRRDRKRERERERERELKMAAQLSCVTHN